MAPAYHLVRRASIGRYARSGEAHYEYDFRINFPAGTPPPLCLTIDQCGLSIIRDARFKYVHFDALPPLFIEQQADPNQFRNPADDPAYAGEVLNYAQ